MNLIPEESDQDTGLRFQIYIYRFAQRFGVDNQQIIELLPQPMKDWRYGSYSEDDWSGYAGYFKRQEDVESFIAGLSMLQKSATRP